MNASSICTSIPLFDFDPHLDNFRAEVLCGLGKPQKELSFKFLYDEHGSHLFDEITDLEAYYPTCTEVALMQDNIEEIAALLGTRCLLIEYGSGSKTRILLDHLQDPAAYIPIDISREHLMRSAMDLVEEYPDLNVLPVWADYTGYFELPPVDGLVTKRVAYFPGSTIGNFSRDEAEAFLRRIAEMCGKGGGLLIGLNLKKDPEILHTAYNDPDGVTAAFNLNVLTRINRELSADFQLDQFRHYAFYNPRDGRVEMHLLSLRDQVVRLNGSQIRFQKGESIWTESSHKYHPDDITQMAGVAGFEVEHSWIDEQELFSVQYLRVR